MEATGTVIAGESNSAMAYIKGRRGISPRQTKLILLVCMLAVGVPVGAWSSGSWIDAAIPVEFSFIGLAVGAFVVQLLAAPLLRTALIKRGQAYEQQLTLRLTHEALVYDPAEVTISASWSCVTDLYRTRKYWVFLVQSSAMVLPRRFFVTADDEREYIAEAMSRMTSGAQARSPDASKLINGGRERR